MPAVTTPTPSGSPTKQSEAKGTPLAELLDAALTLQQRSRAGYDPNRPWGNCSLGEAGTRVERELARRSTKQPPPARRTSARSRERRARSTRRTRVSASASDDSGSSSDPPPSDQRVARDLQARVGELCRHCGLEHPAALVGAHVRWCDGLLVHGPRLIVELEGVST
jgi:hypothetical protein